MLFKNETNKTEFLDLYCRDISAPMEYCRAVYDRNKELVPFTYFTPKQFKEYLRSESFNVEEVKVVGNVHLYQRKYKDCEYTEPVDEFERLKAEKGIYGCFWVPHSEEYFKRHKDKLFVKRYKKFDVYEAKEVHCLGYAQVGYKKFVRLVAVSRSGMAIYIALWLAVVGFILKFGLLINGYGAMNLT